MRECAYCGADCGPAIGMSRELKTKYWGGSKGNLSVDYSPEVVTFFCNDEHRNLFLVSPLPTGEVQTRRWETTGDD